MKRDGNNKSLWQELNSFKPTHIPSLDAYYDVVVVGGGMTGVVTALMLQQAGKKCLLVESYNLGFGTTGGTTAHLNTMMDTPYSDITKKFDAETSRIVANGASAVIKYIEGKISARGIECEFERCAAYLYAQTKDQLDQLDEIYAASKEAGLSLEFTQQLPIAASFQKAVRFEGQGKFHPIKYLFATAKEYESAGGSTLINCSIESAEKSGDEVHITSSHGQIRSRNIIYATHIPPGINLLHLRCAAWRSYAVAVRLKDHQYPEDLVYDLNDPYYYYRTQVVDGQNYLIAGGEDHKTGEDHNTQKHFLRLKAHVESIFNIEDVTHEWSSQYFESADGLPYIGVLPGHADSIYVATGFGGNGMIYSHIAAMELTSQIVLNESRFKEIFTPSRIKPIAGFNNFVDHNKDVVKHFIGTYYGIEKLHELADIAPGEGKVVKVEGHSVAVSKDMNGQVYAVSSKCTHMGCNVSWNASERSWDCPCHGARYSVNGQVLTGPAIHSLEEIKLTNLIGDRH